MIALAITTDGRRECIEQTIPSLLERVHGIDGPRLIFDDSGEQDYRDWLRERFEPEGFWVTPVERERQGQDKALRIIWKHLSRDTYAEHPLVFWSEDDFVFERDVDLTTIAAVLETYPYLAQMALLRQPWFPGEKRAGGIIERDPDEYAAMMDSRFPGEVWRLHRLWFTLNPNLFWRGLCTRPRPVGRKHEWRFSRQLCEDPDVRFGIWGNGDGSQPWVRHIGEERRGRGY